MSEPTGAGWASPGDAGRTPPPAPPAAQPEQPAPVPAAASPAPGWQAVPGWGGETTGPAPAWGGTGWGPPPPAAPRPGVVPLRPLGLGELLDGAVGLVRGYPRPALGVSAVVALVTTLLQLVLLLTVLQPLFDIDPAAFESGDPEELLTVASGVIGATSVTVVVGTVAGAVLTGCMTAIAGRAVLGQPLTAGELWTGLRPKLARLGVGSLLVAAAVYLPLVLAGALTGAAVAVLGAPGAAVGVLLVLGALALGFVSYVRLSLATSALVLEDVPVRTSLRRSWSLVRRSFWRVFGVLALALLVSSVVGQVLQLPFALLAGDGGPLAALSGEAATSLSTRALVLSSLGSGLAQTVVGPFVAGVTALLYVDRRMRAEGLDVALQAAAAPPR